MDMTKRMKSRNKQQWFWIAMICFISLSAFCIAGCAGKTTTSTITTSSDDGSVSGNSTSVTTQKEVTTSAHPRGIVGGVFYTLGQVIIFPFRVIGNLFS